MAINALSGGVDSSTVTMLGHRALGGYRLKSVFIENGLMREGEYRRAGRNTDTAFFQNPRGTRQRDYPRCARHRQCHVQHSPETPFNDRSGLTIMKASAA